VTVTGVPGAPGTLAAVLLKTVAARRGLSIDFRPTGGTLAWIRDIDTLLSGVKSVEQPDRI
jgi:hypothetical protein